MPLKTPFTVVVVGVRESENRCKRSTHHLYPGITPAFPTFSKALRKQPLLDAAAPRAAPLPTPHLVNAALGWCPQRSSAAHSSSCPHITLKLSQAIRGAPPSPGPLADDTSCPADFITREKFPQLRHICGLSLMDGVLTPSSHLFTLEVVIIYQALCTE